MRYDFWPTQRQPRDRPNRMRASSGTQRLPRSCCRAFHCARSAGPQIAYVMALKYFYVTSPGLGFTVTHRCCTSPARGGEQWQFRSLATPPVKDHRARDGCTVGYCLAVRPPSQQHRRRPQSGRSVLPVRASAQGSCAGRTFSPLEPQAFGSAGTAVTSSGGPDSASPSISSFPLTTTPSCSTASAGSLSPTCSEFRAT